MPFSASEIFSRKRSVPYLALIAAIAILLGFQGCSAFRIPEEPPQPTPVTPVWDSDELTEHIRFLNRSDVRGRATGTQGYARAAAYVNARMDEFGLQPAVEGDYRTIYGAPINYPISGRLRSVGLTDSLEFLPGIDFLPDGRSDSGAVSITRFVVAGSNVDPTANRDRDYGIFVPPGETVDLREWRAAGAELAVVIRPLEPRFDRAPIRGLVVVQLAPQAARRLFRLGDAAVDGYLAERRGEVVALGRILSARVATSFQSRAGAINMMGYFSGKHPVRRHKLVIVCADLDALGAYAGVSTLDFRNFGTSAAALLEMARNLGYVTRRWQVPDRSVMIAVWSGSRIENAGLRHFLESPTWSIADVTSLVYVGLAPSERASIEELLAPYDIRLVAIPPVPDPLYPEDILLIPDPTVQRLAGARDEFEPVEMPDMSQLIDSAVVRALDLADRAYERTMIETTDPRPFMPIREDSLQAPTADETD